MKKVMRYKLGVMIFLVFLFLTPRSCFALPEAGEELRLYLGEPKIISVSNPTRIVIANPNMVDVTNVSKSEMTISPKAAGTTTLVFWDNFGEQSYKIKVFSEDMNDIKRRIDNLLARLNLPEVNSRAEEEEGKVLLLGRVKNTQDKERIALALGPLKEKTTDLIEVKEEEAGVEIDVQVLELSKDATNTLGFSWPGALNLIEKGSTGISDAGASFHKGEALFKIFNLQRGTSSGADPYTFRLDALIQEGKARVLSRPRLVCQSGKEAELLVGGEKPVFTTAVQATTGTSTNVEYKEFGIKLKIKPTVIIPEERIKLALSVEVSEVGTAETIGLTSAPTAKAYPLTKRTASTELFLNDGQTMAIGGLIKQKSAEDIRKTPWLGDLPILGVFFRKKTTTTGGGTGERGDTELFIALTPKIISENKDAKEVKKEIKPKAAPSNITGNIPEPIAGYAGIIQKRILENLSYPPQAKEAGFQGTVKLSLYLSYRGELLDIKIKDSSGYKILDDNAIRVAKEVSSYPPFPSSIEQKEIQLEIPIVYRLD